MNNENILNYYSQRIESLNQSLRSLKSRTSRLYLVRFALFVLFIGAFLLLFSGENLLLYALLSALFFSSFAAITIYDVRMSRLKGELQRRVDFNADELRALDLDFHHRGDGAHYAACDPHLSGDFDIFGKGSIYQYMNRSQSLGGRDRFAASLVACDLRPDSIRERQAAIKELSAKREFIESFVSSGAEVQEQGGEVENLQEWLTQECSSERFINVVRLVMPPLTLGSLLLAILGVVSYGPFTIFFLLSLALVYSSFSKLNQAHSLLGRSAKIFDKYADLIALIESEQMDSELLRSERARLFTAAEGSASGSIAALKSLLNRFDYRCNIYVSIVLNGLLAFDFWTYVALLKWKRGNRGSAAEWFDALFNIDSLLGYAIYAYNCGDRVDYAEILEGDFHLSASNMNHPLIKADVSVSNSIEIAGRPSIVIITGANMAGKSTFLRTLTVNMLLAMNGCPVSAKSFALTPVQLLSSIKIHDSLMNRESYFYAELLRLSTILERMAQQPQSMVILDEILRGTNTKDKQQGSLGLLKRIMARNGVAIIATHDLVIGKMEEEYPAHVVNYCFEVEIEGDQLSFDYKLKRGVSSKLNASFLMRRMGIID